MSFKNKISSLKYDRSKRRQEKQVKRFNHKQEELNVIYKKEKQKNDFKSLLGKLKFESYIKRLVAIVVFVALIDLQLSYVLAFLGKDQIAETLSVQICTTLLGTILVYIIREYFDIKAENKNEMIKSGYKVDDETINNKIKEILNKSGLNEHIKYNKLEPENPNDSNKNE